MGDSGDELECMLPANCPSPYFDTWDRHNSIAFSATKGLRNAPGENNCFVNCAVQVSSVHRYALETGGLIWGLRHRYAYLKFYSRPDAQIRVPEVLF